MGNPIPENDNVADFIVDLTYIKEEQDTQNHIDEPEHHSTPLLVRAQMESDDTIDEDRYSQRYRMSKGLCELPPDQFEYSSNRRFNSTHTLPSMHDTDTSSISGHHILHDALIQSYRCV
jgi:hypothetical protein